jgi:hypothetical protein
MAEPPGGSVGCDMCGVLLDAAKTAAHDAWHRAEEERFDRLARAVRELIRRVVLTWPIKLTGPHACVRDGGPWAVGWFT